MYKIHNIGKWFLYACLCAFFPTLISFFLSFRECMAFLVTLFVCLFFSSVCFDKWLFLMKLSLFASYSLIFIDFVHLFHFDILFLFFSVLNLAYD